MTLTTTLAGSRQTAHDQIVVAEQKSASSLGPVAQAIVNAFQRRPSKRSKPAHIVRDGDGNMIAWLHPTKGWRSR